MAKRVWANKLRCLLDEIDPPRSQPGSGHELEPMSVGEQQEFGNTLIDFGQHAGQPYREVPRSYLEWLADRSRLQFRNLRRFLMTTEVGAHSE